MPKIIDKSVTTPPAFSLDPRELEFGKKFAANMFTCKCVNGKWEDGELGPMHDFSLHPAALVFHYGQAIFEGMKAYRGTNGEFLLFRPELNAKRMNTSARRMCLPEIPEQFYLEITDAIVKSNRAYIPERPGNLYIRPTMIATEPCIGVRSGNEILFFMIALPAGRYFKGDVVGAGAVDVLVSEDVARAARGGTGSVKAAANYAISIKTINEAKDLGCAQVLFLDAVKGDSIEEMGGMNVFFSDGRKLITPMLTDTILAGVTRQTIIEFARAKGIAVEERKVTISEVMSGVADGTIIEGMACGTAAVITGINSLRLSKSGTVAKFPIAPGPLTTRLYDELTAIQFGTAPDEFGWRKVVR